MDYDIIRRDILFLRGGMAVYIADHLQFNLRNIENSSNIEALWFELIPPKSKKILFGSLYRPPNSNASVFSKETESTVQENASFGRSENNGLRHEP